MSESDPHREQAIDAHEANYWWRKNDPAGALLNNLTFLFIIGPIALVMKRFYVLSFVVFALMIPYSLLVRRLAGRAVRNHLEKYPEEREDFEETGVISG